MLQACLQFFIVSFLQRRLETLPSGHVPLLGKDMISSVGLASAEFSR